MFYFSGYAVIQAVDAALSEDQPNKALILSLRLNEDTLIKKCIFAVSPADIPAVTLSIPYRYLQRLIEAFADVLESCPHLEFILRWSQVYFRHNFQLFQLILFILHADNICTVLLSRSHSWIVIWFVWQELCKAHGNSIQQNSRNLLPALISLNKAITRIHQDLQETCSSNQYKLQYLCATSTTK